MEPITLSNLGQKSEQEVFDFVSNHLLTQNEKSSYLFKNKYRKCAYRGSNDLKCAAGCLISEEEYDSGMENHDWDQLVKDNKVPSQHKELISELQVLHDSWNINNWKEGLENISIKRKLKWNR